MQDTPDTSNRTNIPSWLPAGAEAVVIGASGGIGAALTARLVQHPSIEKIHALSRRTIEEVTKNKIRKAFIDVTDETSVKNAANAVSAPHLVIVATGILHDTKRRPEKTWRELDLNWLEDTMRINAFGPALVAKHFLPRIPRKGRSAFAAVSARVGSISDNRLGGWYGYRASKAALNMLLKTLSIELARTHPDACILGLHPGTVNTDLSEPFQRGVPERKLFTPEFSASQLLTAIDRTDATHSGALIAWDGEKIPY